MVKRLGYGVYEVDGYVIDVLNTSMEDHEKMYADMNKDEFVRYAVAVAIANHYGCEDGLWPDVVTDVNLSIDELRKVYRENACDLYDDLKLLKCRETDEVVDESFGPGRPQYDADWNLISRE